MSSNKSFGTPDDNDPQSLPSCTVYFDDQCPLCSREIAAYWQMRGSNAINWVDASQCDVNRLGVRLDRNLALRRLHARSADGSLISGASAFVEIWRHLPAFAWLVRFCSSQRSLALLDFAYTCFLAMRSLWRKPPPVTR